MKVSRYYMPSVSLRQLRDTRRLKTWLQSGNTVELLERDRVIARIGPGQPGCNSRGLGWGNPCEAGLRPHGIHQRHSNTLIALS